MWGKGYVIDWDAVAAIGTLLAVIVALFLPFLDRWLKHRSDDRRIAIRTEIFTGDFSTTLLAVSARAMDAVDLLRHFESSKADPRYVEGSFLAACEDRRLFVNANELLALSRDELEFIDPDIVHLVSRFRGVLSAYDTLVDSLRTSRPEREKQRSTAIIEFLPGMIELFNGVGDIACRLALGVANFNPSRKLQMRTLVANWGQKVALPIYPPTRKRT